MIAAVSTSLLDHVASYCLEKMVSPEYESVLRRAVEHLNLHAGRPLYLHDLSDDTLNAWAAAMRAAGLKPKTIKNKLSCLLALWRHAWQTQRLASRPERVVKIRVPDGQPVAWSVDEFTRLVAAAEDVPGYFRATGLRRADFWAAFAWVVFDTGLRLGDVLELRRVQFSAAGQAGVVQHKTGRLHAVQVRPATLSRIDRLGPFDGDGRDGLVFWWPVNSRGFYQQLGRVVAAAGLNNDHGLTRRLRRTSATAFERVAPGQAWVHLGHSAPGLDRRSYVDRSKLPAARPLPPVET